MGNKASVNKPPETDLKRANSSQSSVKSTNRPIGSHSVFSRMKYSFSNKSTEREEVNQSLSLTTSSDTSEYPSRPNEITASLVSYCQTIRNKIPAFTLDSKEIDLQLRLSKLLDCAEKHLAGSEIDHRLVSLTLVGISGLDFDDVSSAETFLHESFKDIVVPSFEIDREKCVHEGFIHAVADAIVGIENNNLYTVDEPGRKGFAFTTNKSNVNNGRASTVLNSFDNLYNKQNSSDMDEKFFNFEDIGPENSYARKLLKQTIGDALAREIRDNRMLPTDAFLILSIGEAKNRIEAKNAIIAYHQHVKCLYLRVINRQDEKDDEHITNYDLIDEQFGLYFTRLKRINYLTYLINRDYVAVQAEFASFFQT